MTISLKHATQAVGVYEDDGELGTAEWNEEHALTMSADYILGRATSGDGAVEEIPCTAAGRALISGANAAAQRTTLGLGTSATYDIGTSGAVVPLTNGDNVWTGAMRIGDGTGDAYMRINGAAGYDRGFYIRTNNVNRWFMGGSSTAESGSNVGTDFLIWRNDDAGTYIDAPFRITRSTGRTTLKELSLTTVLSVLNGGTGASTASDARTNLGLGTAATQNTGTTGANIPLLSANNTWGGNNQKFGDGTGSVYTDINGAAANDRSLRWRTGGVNRWTLNVNTSAESGSNAGSNFDLYRYDDAGAYVDTALSVNRSTGKTTLKELGLSTSLSVSNGGTGSTTASGARTALGLAIGTDVQAYDADLAAIAALTSAADKMPYATGAGTWAMTDLTAAGRALLDDADAAAQRTTLGVGTGDSPQFTAVNVGAATDTTLARVAAGIVGVEGLGIPLIIAQSGTAQTVGAVTTETVLATITVPAGIMGPNGTLYVFTQWTTNNNANNKNCYIRVGGSAGTAMTQFTNTAHVGASRLTIIQNANSQSSQKCKMPPANAIGFGQFSSNGTTAAVDTSAAWDLVISGNKANSADTLTLESYSVMVLYGA